MRGPSLRIRIHYARKQTPAGVLGRRLSGDGKRPAAVRFNRTIACVCIELLSQANDASYPQAQTGPSAGRHVCDLRSTNLRAEHGKVP